MMLAVLPRQNTDDLGGELFVAAYERHLGGYPQDAIEYLTDRATGECRWFPTIAECRQILEAWRRTDSAALRRDTARRLEGRERMARVNERNDPPPALREITQAEVDGMSDEMRRFGMACGAITQTADGRFVPAGGS